MSITLDESTHLAKWLGSTMRQSSSYKHFDVVDIEQISDLTPAIKAYIANLLRDARHSPEFLAATARHLGWNTVRESIIAFGSPRIPNAKRGEFGEALTNAILEQFHGYTIPVPKLRFKLTSDQSLPATDTLALKLDSSGAIIEVCFVESKLRTTAATSTALEGYNQLQEDYSAKIPAIMIFVAERLFEREDPLSEPFFAYMRDRNDNRDKDVFELSLCWDIAAWTDTTLSNLEDNCAVSPKLTVHLIRLPTLRQLTDELFVEVGVAEVLDDE